MNRIQLPFWDIRSARQEMPELAHHARAYWVGAVSNQDHEAHSLFVSQAKAGLIDKLVDFQQVGGNLTYGVVVEQVDANKKLLLIDSPESPAADEKCVLCVALARDWEIQGYQPTTSRVEEQLRAQSPLGAKEIIKALFRRR